MPRLRGRQRTRGGAWIDTWQRHRLSICQPVHSPISLRGSLIRGADLIAARRRLLILSKGRSYQAEEGRNQRPNSRFHRVLLEFVIYFLDQTSISILRQCIPVRLSCDRLRVNFFPDSVS